MQIDLLRGISILDPQLKVLEIEKEQRRYKRQEESVKAMGEGGMLAPGLTLTQARDLLWAFTGRDFYRMLVVERGWSSEAYEEWLAKILIQTLL